MGAGVDLEELTRRRLRPLVDVHTSAVLLTAEAIEVGPEEPWAASILARLGSAHRRAFEPMVTTGLVPDLVLDVEHWRRGFRDRLEGVARAAPRDLVAELAASECAGRTASWRNVLRSPERWLATVAVAVSRVLPVAHGLLLADRAQLGRLVADIDAADQPGTVATLLADLHARTEISGGQWRLPGNGPLSPADEGLVVVLTLTTPEHSLISRHEDRLTTLFAGVSTSERDHVALMTLLGGVRAALLRSLSEPQRVTQLGERFSLAASVVSYHVATLERMQLVVRRRRGRSVFVTRSERGEQLLALYGADRLSGRNDPAVVNAIST